jgi:aryl-alcohol dehydrogenase-like predicted oxidoreductase
MYALFDSLVDEGPIAGCCVSFEEVEQARTAMAQSHSATVAIVANHFRLEPFEEATPAAEWDGVGIRVRFPTSWLLAARYSKAVGLHSRRPQVQPRWCGVRRSRGL